VTAALRVFADLLRRWNKTVNLVSPSDLEQLWPRHIEDSLQLATIAAPLPARAADLGSGAGFPGLVLSIAFGIEFELIEQDQRKAAFLREAIMATGAPAHVHAMRIEDARLTPAPLVTARALAPLGELIRLARPLLTDDGFCLFPKGRTAEQEITDAERDWSMRIERLPGRTDPSGTVLRVSDPRPRQ
jgi:16S rRNA (guanine527-N7)-methyltransferase